MHGIILQKGTEKELNRLAREKMKLKLLSDIRIDIEICKIEGWNIKEYIEELSELLGSFINEK